MTPSTALSDEQERAVRADPTRPWLIAAGPGTGKTFTLVERFAWLVETRGAAPESILTLTFTEAAASELRRRLEDRLGRALDEAWIGTFHAVCGRLIREHAYEIAGALELTILDEVEQRLLLDDLARELRRGALPSWAGAEAGLQPEDLDRLVRHGPPFILRLKSGGVSPGDLDALLRQGADLGDLELSHLRALHDIYSRYEANLSRRHRMDFSDLLLKVIDAVGRSERLRRRLGDSFRFVLVDEFQDTDRVQLELVRQLSHPGFANVTVVGDAKQAIFGWRGADVENVRTKFPGGELPLTLNRRSGQPILDFATDFVRRDPAFAGEPDLVATRRPAQGSVSVVLASGDRQEARWVASEIRRLQASGVPFGRIAILAHSVRALPPEFDEELSGFGVPCSKQFNAGLFGREEVRDALAILRACLDPMHSPSLLRVLEGPLGRLADGDAYRLLGGRAKPREVPLAVHLDEVRRAGFPGLEAHRAERLERLLQAIERAREEAESLGASELLNGLLESTGYFRWIGAGGYGEPLRERSNLAQLSELALAHDRRQRTGALDFLQQAVKTAELEGAVVPEPEPPAADRVAVMTLHRAKGLEFDAVFCVQLHRRGRPDSDPYSFDFDSGQFGVRRPKQEGAARGSGAVADLRAAERRRAIYVGLTRARDRLYVSCVEDRLVRAPEVAELHSWALSHPDLASVLRPDEARAAVPPVKAPPSGELVDRAIGALESAAARRPGRTEPAASVSFSRVETYLECPLRYRLRYVLGVPEPPLRGSGATGRGGVELGDAVHRALALWHRYGGELAAYYRGPANAVPMLATYTRDPLAQAPTLACEAPFSLDVGQVRLVGVVDRVARLDGRSVIVDYKTDARLTPERLERYAWQLRAYRLAARAGLLPGGDSPDLLLHDLRSGRSIAIAAADREALGLVRRAWEGIRSEDFELRPEHARRDCEGCRYRPVCGMRR